ncbi:ABC transporter permease [Acholeplasma hippikon]|uniref:ABC-type transport system involved in multi-copper enzyme maturation, permease component n=1 Tax=Acholeplasma hippikon TaxID=264636 RepID=A0A449BIF7_9MOLU|nr:ABC transporter permease [Acholeplasma hippikon]VEU82220.1 ABC-type transport system involved in multi-copper enzyme maturation, permease component [Acholeplasma hippikon]
MKTIGIIIKKELRRFFTDKRMLISLILPGILIFVIYNFMGSAFQNTFKPNTEYVVYIENEPVELKGLLEIDGLTFKINEEELTQEEILERIKNKEIDAYIFYEEDFYNKMIAYNPSLGTKAPNIEIYYNSSNQDSQNFYAIYTSGLETFETTISNKFDINNSETKYDLATDEDMSVMIISMMLPFLLMTFLFTGAMGICTESIAGEKERGTIATLLITPAKRHELALGKIIALGITSLTSALASFIGLMASLPALLGDGITLSVYGFGTLALVLLVIMFTVLFFTTALSIISAFAKTVKEASSLAVPLMMLVMLVGVTGFMNTSVTSNSLLYLLPIYNSIQCFSGLLSLTINPLNLLLTIISNGVMIGIGVFVLAKMFNSEKIMFNK